MIVFSCRRLGSRVDVATGMLLLPEHNPVIGVAEEAEGRDRLVRGRLDTRCASDGPRRGVRRAWRGIRAARGERDRRRSPLQCAHVAATTTSRPFDGARNSRVVIVANCGWPALANLRLVMSMPRELGADELVLARGATG
ncbi:hypothetical protein ABLO02_16690 [Mycobacterium tuberculosis]